jgi:hypothetical protein
MAIFHLTAKIIGRKAGQSSIACAAYRSGEAIEDTRTREVHRYGRPERVAHAEILAPADAPAWATSRADLWNQVELREKRKDAQLAREFEVALPAELSLDQQRELARSWIAAEITPAGAIADLAIHVDKAVRNPHAHIMATMRPVSADGWGAQKLRQWEDRAALARWRESWAAHTNAALERAGFEARVDHRSHADRGLEEEPTIKEGYAARRRVALGLDSARVAENAAIHARNLSLREHLARSLAKAIAKRARSSQAADALRDLVRGRAAASLLDQARLAPTVPPTASKGPAPGRPSLLDQARLAPTVPPTASKGAAPGRSSLLDQARLVPAAPPTVSKGPAPKRPVRPAVQPPVEVEDGLSIEAQAAFLAAQQRGR